MKSHPTASNGASPLVLKDGKSDMICSPSLLSSLLHEGQFFTIFRASCLPLGIQQILRALAMVSLGSLLWSSEWQLIMMSWASLVSGITTLSALQPSTDAMSSGVTRPWIHTSPCLQTAPRDWSRPWPKANLEAGAVARNCSARAARNCIAEGSDLTFSLLPCRAPCSTLARILVDFSREFE